MSKLDFGLGLRPVHFAPLLGSGIFPQDGPAWKHSRALLRPHFASNRSQNFEEIKRCVESLQQVAVDGIIDLQPLFLRLTFDTTTFLLFGETMSSLASKDVAGQESESAKHSTFAQEYLSHRGRLGLFYWLANTLELRRMCKITCTFVDAAIQSALDAADNPEKNVTEPGKQYALLMLSSAKLETKKPLRDQCLNVLLVGRDTTACCLTWTMRLLARHQDVLHKLRVGVEATVGLGQEAAQPTREQLKKMKYLVLVLKEFLRPYLSVPINSRAAAKTPTLRVGGANGQSPVLIRKGEAVSHFVYAMHRRKVLYGEDALQVSPERWEDGRLSKNIGYGYLPFNGGPRVCLGQDFALLEAGYTIVRIVKRFSCINVPDGEEIVEVGKDRQNLTLVVAPEEGGPVQLRSRFG